MQSVRIDHSAPLRTKSFLEIGLVVYSILRIFATKLTQ